MKTSKGLLLIAVCLSAVMGYAQARPGDWKAATPASVGLDAAKLAAFDADIAAGKYGNVDSLLVIRHGKLAFERRYPHDYDQIYGKEAKVQSALNAHDPSGQYNYFNPWWHPTYRRGELHTLQSVSKTITSVIIGAAIGRGDFPSIDTPVLNFFDTSKVANIDERKKKMTIRHLLTMTAGFDWNEDLPYSDPKNSGSVMEASFDWVQYTIDYPMKAEPGTVFQYNSGASQILSHIFRKATGKDVEEYGAKYLFAPLGITSYYWKRTPTGLPDTEGGVYLAPRDLAKIAYLYLHNGSWEGKQVVPADWVRESIKPQVAVGRGKTKYGFKWWLYSYGDQDKYAFSGSGFGGQFPLVIPEYDLVIVVNAWNVLPGGKSSLGPGEIMKRMIEALSKK